MIIDDFKKLIKDITNPNEYKKMKDNANKVVTNIKNKSRKKLIDFLNEK